MLDVLLDVILPVLLVAVIGGLVGRKIVSGPEALSGLVFYLFSPALVLASLTEVELGGAQVGRMIVVALCVFALNTAVALVWGRVRGADAIRTTMHSGCSSTESIRWMPSDRVCEESNIRLAAGLSHTMPTRPRVRGR